MKATITTLSPVHIGNGTTYNKNIDYFQKGSEIGILDEEKVLAFIGEDNIHQWVSAIERGGDAVPNLLKSRGWRENDLNSVSRRTIALANPDNKSTMLKEHFRTALSGVCIPGSSLKGAVRTALFNHLADGAFLSALTIDDLKDKRNRFNADKLEKLLFGNNANEKSTRFIKFRDVHFKSLKTEVHELRILDAFEEGWFFKEGEQILVESIPAKAVTDFDIIFDYKLLELNSSKNSMLWPDNKISFLTKGIPNICKIINSFTSTQVEVDFNDLKNENLEDGEDILEKYREIFNECNSCSENEFVIRIGGHSGYIFTTGRWVEDSRLDISDDDFTHLRKTIQKREYHDMDLWPKTRKISTEGQIFGFVKVKIF